MKVAILAGGLGTRIMEETEVKPKPLVEIGERPILWHIMKHYAGYGFKEFVIALGYKGYLIKRFFLEQATLQGNLTVEMQTGKAVIRDQVHEDWQVHLVDTRQLPARGMPPGPARQCLPRRCSRPRSTPKSGSRTSSSRCCCGPDKSTSGPSITIL